VRFLVASYHIDEEGGSPYVVTPEIYWTTNSNGSFILSIQVEYATFFGLVSMGASVTDSRYIMVEQTLGEIIHLTRLEVNVCLN